MNTILIVDDESSYREPLTSILDGWDFAAVDLVNHPHANEIQILMNVGKLDFLLEDNRRMSALLMVNGYHVTYRKYSDGHNQTSWRNNIWRGLEVMLPPTG